MRILVIKLLLEVNSSLSVSVAEVVQVDSIFSFDVQLDTVEVGPFHVVAEVMDIATNSIDLFLKLRELLSELSIESLLLRLPDGIPLGLETGAVLLVHGEEPVVVLTKHLNRESIDAMRKSMSTKFILPLREISTLNRRHSISLLPFGQIVLVGSGVETVHPSLQTQDRGSILCSLQVQLRNKVV